ncbi:aminotransferase class I/II-fold pyridoxal phosphate-dependent enzyme [Galbibacter pacificus]|uniref:Pyridoxal phosphate-dependent aminotransferase family protein n=1 Tax=Galbibacter pacificus TaxID=2996052 RepID=A0ABT6FSL1_9FLAO|nr:pyridoxal phosphate-dependent aminotransferase family protein [Galbibacter pacificus]MDG3582623.1 pyridoxal phosphate-dependent aminotransferase family protein [Galbibacter pacificus]MDG3586258.1 pyridoxal phosphate-dependent aminotransferase family protein [Galbibacter pacificus]
MQQFPKKLLKKIRQRQDENALRKLPEDCLKVDFSSNDYLGFSRSAEIFKQTSSLLEERKIMQNGATGSRLLTGNHQLYTEVEALLCDFHDAEASLVFNSGYDANIGFFASVPQRGDVVLVDEYIHASIRDGLQMGNAKSFKFKHNDLNDLESKLKKHAQIIEGDVYVVTESVFSMDGDSPDLISLTVLTKKYNAHLIVDEAHAVGVFGDSGEGLLQELQLQNKVFARIITFGKALGCHGATILGSIELKNYLVNFARSFIYTTGLSPHSLATIFVVYQELKKQHTDSSFKKNKQKLLDNIAYFKHEIAKTHSPGLQYISSHSAIQCCVVPGNENVKKTAVGLQQKGFDVKPILSPTVKKGAERLRFCMHSFNTFDEISVVLDLLMTANCR